MITLSLFQLLTLTALVAVGLVEAFVFGYFYAKDAPKANVLKFRRPHVR